MNSINYKIIRNYNCAIDEKTIFPYGAPTAFLAIRRVYIRT